MASTKISGLVDLIAALAAADLLAIVDDDASATKKVSITDFFANVPVDLSLVRDSGSSLNFKTATVVLSAMSGATVTASNLIPAGSFIIGVTTRVTTEITGATTFDIGDGTDPDRWGAAILLPAGTVTDVTDFTAAGFGQFSTANDVVLTANVANFTAGAVRLVVHFLDLTAPTS